MVAIHTELIGCVTVLFRTLLGKKVNGYFDYFIMFPRNLWATFKSKWKLFIVVGSFTCLLYTNIILFYVDFLVSISVFNSIANAL